MNTLKIVEPFWAGWKFYGWEKPIPGIGINQKIVTEAQRLGEKIKVTIGKDKTVYQISPTTVINLAKKYNSIRTVRNGVKVYVVPQNELTKGGE